LPSRFRDPVHGFIEVSELENKIIDSQPFQRLRNIKQLAMTHLVFHGAEHTRFGHSLGVMFLVSRAFRSVLKNSKHKFAEDKQAYYEQILRLIALTHDLGHAPFSHAAEDVFPVGIGHEDFTEKIIMETCIANCINEIGEKFKEKYGSNYDITPELICDIYRGRIPGPNCDYTILKSFMDSELDCDKMDYLLRDSLFCGVNYGKYDIERLLSCLTIYEDQGNPRLAITYGGVQAFEEFVLARYFMFVQVYFHRTRRYFDIMLVKALRKILADGRYPDVAEEYIKWDDCRVLSLMHEKCEQIEECKNIVRRIVCPEVLCSPTHPQSSDKREFFLLANNLSAEFGGGEFFIEDHSADKMPHKIPTKTEVDDERAIVIVNDRNHKYTTISEESYIIKSLTDKIDIRRLYAHPTIADKAQRRVKASYDKIAERQG
jgi:HD superfamily phosphohydrolase